jgi:predicted nucleotide-binding protein
MFESVFCEVVQVPSSDVEELIDDTAVFVVHGRDMDANDAMWSLLEAIGFHPLDLENDLVAYMGQGTPFVGQILDVALKRAMAVVVLITPDDMVKLHPDLLQPGEEAIERELSCQPRPNVLFEAGMAFGFNPTRTILVEIGRRRPVSDLGGRHTIRLGTEDALVGLARRLEVAGCAVDRSTDPTWSKPDRFSSLGTHSRHS